MSGKLLSCSRSRQVTSSHRCTSCSNPALLLHVPLYPQSYTPSNEPEAPLQLGSALIPVAQTVPVRGREDACAAHPILFQG